MKRYPDQYQASDFVFFLHIPKTAGTSVSSMLESIFDEDAIIKPIQFNNVRKYPKAVLERAGFLAGHYPHRAIVRRLPRQPNLRITFLREPMAHFESLFFHLQIDPTFIYTTRLLTDKELAQNIHSEIKGMEIEEFLESEHCAMFENFQLRYLVNGLCAGTERKSDAMLLPLAESMLLSLPFFGLTERFEESTRLLETTMGLDTPLPVRRHNASRNRPKKYTLSDRAREMIRERTLYDRRLYDFASTAFDHRLGALEN